MEKVVISVKTGLNPRKNFQLNTQDAKNYYVTVKEMTSGKIVFSDRTDKINDEAISIISNRSNLEFGDVLFSGIGTIGKIAIVDIPVNNWNVSESVFVIKPNINFIVAKFLMYVLGSNYIKNQYEGKSVGSTLKGVRMATLLAIEIPIPPIKVQKRIVAILDKFDKLVCDINEGLPAEINARRKQYEYYRDKLLTFKEA
ncbi:hypothetical protein AGMMS49936_01080 [Endomicrobiia bacterium]|nr:hypothetical protein AGMMS49936_01080 [Endomicrobiia bacterium]